MNHNPRRSLGILLLRMAGGLLGTALAPLVGAQPVESAAYNKVQAAYIYKIASYVTWPDAGSESAFTICIVEQGEALAKVLREATASRNIQQLPVNVLSFSNHAPPPAASEFRHCRLVYLYQPPAGKTLAWLQSLAEGEASVLWIASPEVEADSHALFALEIERGRMVIYLNRERLSASDLVVAAPLLSVARPR
ncbi:YfiR family protein [Ketobacter sp.]|uniref:YfiR family protein n=1 Tax=Ketobacter sp. TaxID=2083498 RepID=UPI000F2391A3|nr:YfiR family protein [Ketobacter sp.]RLT94780.1 MAG: YfiR family protein [Ketobacter sp.]